VTGATKQIYDKATEEREREREREREMESKVSEKLHI
jgi:hypothetical protein